MAKENTINGGGGASTQSNSIDSKASVLSGYSLSTSVQTVVGAINEIEGKLGIVSYPENTIDNSSNVIRLGKDSPEVVKKKVFGGVPYVIIEPSETWNSEYYSNLLDEDGFNSWYENTIADNTCIYEIYNVLTVQNGEENGFMINIRVLKPQPAPGPMAAMTGTEASTDPLDLIDIKCVFANNEESILSYALSYWETTKHVIYTEPPVSYPIREGSGYNSAIMGHYRNRADGDYSVAEGLDSNASGESSHAEGVDTQASGLGSHAEGCHTRAIGDYSHTEGSGTRASGTCSHAEGEVTTASGYGSHAEGVNTITNNSGEHAEGYYNVSNSGKTDDLRTRHSVGIGSRSSNIIRVNAHEIMANGDHYIYGLGGYDGTNAIKETSKTLQEVINGKQDTLDLSDYQTSTDETLQTTDKTIVGAINELASKPSGVGKVDPNSDGTGEVFNSYEGDSANVASGIASHAEGSYTNATGDYSHAEGTGTEAIGSESHAEGYCTNAIGSNSHAEGLYTTASGHSSHAEGYNTQTFSQSEHAEGSYNKSYDSTTYSIRVIHSVGIGSPNGRKNAHEIKFNGDHYIYGIGGFDGTNSADAQSLQTVLSNLGPNIIEVPELTGDYNIPANATKREFRYIINIGATLYSVTGDSAIKWAGGIAPQTSTNSTMVVSILNNLATWNIFMSV